MILAPLQTTHQLSFEESIQIKCLTHLAYFSAHEDDMDSDDMDVDDENKKPSAFDSIENCNFNYKRNEDIFYRYASSQGTSI